MGRCSEEWWVPEIGVPPVLIHFRLEISIINQPFWIPPCMETPIWNHHGFTMVTHHTAIIIAIRMVSWKCIPECHLQEATSPKDTKYHVQIESRTSNWKSHGKNLDPTSRKTRSWPSWYGKWYHGSLWCHFHQPWMILSAINLHFFR